jgi:crossover junction endodeoxyribonuclease RuvC
VRVLGIDPGLVRTGYGCIDIDRRGNVSLVEAGVFRLTASKPVSHRLGQLWSDLRESLDELKPDRLAVERIFVDQRYLKTAVVMAHARGVVLLAAQERGIPLGEVAPAQAKKALTGNGRATKRQVQLAVMECCGLERMPTPSDVSDAIAIALSYARRIPPL